MVLRVGFSAYPAPLELADVARHVVAPRLLLNLGLAFRAEGNVDVCPLKDLRVQLLGILFTSLAGMFCFSACETHSIAALFTLHRHSPVPWGSTEAFAPLPRAPSN
jgi:hypothetical protein